MNHIEAFIINHWPHFVALMVILLLIFLNERMAQKKRPKILGPSGVIELINHNNAKVIDLRDAQAFKEGHIIDAIRASADDVEHHKIMRVKEDMVILVCAKGLQSESLATKLKQQGYHNFIVLRGGIDGWKAAGMPIIKGK